MPFYQKDPDAKLDYTIDWSTWLGDDTIADSDWTVETGLTEVTASNTDTTTTIWLSGGTEGTTYDVTNEITTAAGRIEERTIRIYITER